MSLAPVPFLRANFLTVARGKEKTLCKLINRIFLEKYKKLPYLESEFLSVARTRQDSKNFDRPV